MYRTNPMGRVAEGSKTMSVKIVITIEDGANNHQKIEAKTIRDESSTNENNTATWIHRVVQKFLDDGNAVYFEQRSDKL